MRLIPEFKEVFGEKEEFPTENRTFKKGDREYSITVEKEMIGDHPWFKRINISYEAVSYTHLDVYKRQFLESINFFRSIIINHKIQTNIGLYAQPENDSIIPCIRPGMISFCDVPAGS